MDVFTACPAKGCPAGPPAKASKNLAVSRAWRAPAGCGMSQAGRGKPYTDDPERRRVRSFVLRQGRFTEAQQRAFDELWPRYGLDYQGAPRDFTEAFGRTAPLVLEIGTGNGEALRYAAARDPDRDHIGIEVHAPGVGRLLNALAKDGSSNSA